MKMIVTWLLGVPVAVAFLFAVFAVDASKLSTPTEQRDVKPVISNSPSGATTRSEGWRHEARLS